MRLYIKFEAEIDLIPRIWKNQSLFAGHEGINIKWLFIKICWRNRE